MTEDKNIEFCVEALKENYSAFRDNVWKLAGLGLLAVGWLITEKDARDFLMSIGYWKFFLSWAFLLGGAAHAFINFQIYKRSQELIKYVKDKLEPSIFKNYEVSLWIYVFNTIVIFTIMGSGVILIGR